jgi:hypothetical protein
MDFIPTAIVSSEAQLSLSAQLLKLLQLSGDNSDQFLYTYKH